MTEPRRTSPVVDAGTLWAGGLAAAVVAALVVVVGILLLPWGSGYSGARSRRRGRVG